jgi:hypothetical protein
MAGNPDKTMTNIVLTPTIFHEDWWLDAATDGAYKVAEVSTGGSVVGRLPYCLGRKLGLKWGALPALTHFLGPAVDEGEGGINRRFIRRLEITRDLIRQLPDAHFLRIKCHRAVREVIAFQEQKFRTSVQFTYEVHPAAKDTLWSNFRHERRRVILKAEALLDIAPFDDPEVYLRFYLANLKEKGIKSKLNETACLRLIKASMERGRGQILAAKDKKGDLQAAIFCVWDAGAVYYLMTTRTASSDNGAVSALIWRVIQDAAQQNLIFDLDGLATPGSIMFYAGFGATVEPRYVATKMSFPVTMAREALTLLGHEQYFF